MDFDLIHHVIHYMKVFLLRGIMIYWILIFGCLILFFIFKKIYKKRKNLKEHPIIYVKRSEDKPSNVKTVVQQTYTPYSQDDYIRDKQIFYREFVDECWRTIHEPSPHPDVSKESGLYFMQHSLSAGHAEYIRSLQIIRNSIDIIMESKKESTINSRMEVIAEHYQKMQDMSYLFDRRNDYERIHERFAELIKFIHIAVYVNIAQGYIEKMESVKTDKTRKKYLLLAIEALENGLNDTDADHDVLHALIAEMKSNELHSLVK